MSFECVEFRPGRTGSTVFLGSIYYSTPITDYVSSGAELLIRLDKEEGYLYLDTDLVAERDFGEGIARRKTVTTNFDEFTKDGHNIKLFELDD